MAALAGTAPKSITQTPLIIGDLRSPMSDANAPEVKFVERRLGYMQFLASTEQIERIDFLYAELPESKQKGRQKILPALATLRAKLKSLQSGRELSSQYPGSYKTTGAEK